ncbi:MetS family NSS transporter small subunit [Cellulosilyticum sp. I15G10I2]|nr:MetS family NSS transporter small subunit [Cellulosilyticum sp. I15G10I2]
MSTSAIIMMIIGCGTVWGGVIVTILIALAVEKKNNLKKEMN